MLAVTLSASALGTVTYTVQADAQLVGAGNTVAALVTRDPNQTFAQFNAPAGNGLDFSPVAVLRQTGIYQLPNIPVLAGEGISVAFSGAGSATLYFTQP